MKPTWDGTFWVQRAVFPGLRELIRGKDRGRLEVVFSPEASSEENPPSAAQVATLAHLLANHGSLAPRLVHAATKHYYQLRPRYLEFARKWPKFELPEMPERLDEAAFRRLHELQGCFIHPTVSGRLAYVGFSMRAEWEREHGVGLLTHGQRVVSVGNADHAFLQWVAERDLVARKRRSRSRSR